MKRLTILFPVLLGMILAGCGNHVYEQAVESLRNQRYAEAVEQFTQSIEQERNISDSCRGIGIANWELGNYEEAAAALEKALEHSAEEQRTGVDYNLLGACMMKLGHMEKAIEYYELGLEKPDTTDEMRQEMKFNIISAYEKLGDWENARQKLAEYVAEYPEDQEALKEAQFLETR